MKTILFFVFLIVLIACKTENKSTTQSNEFKHATFKIDKPIESVDFKETFSIDMSNDTIIILESGSFVKIPEYAFVNNNGEKVENAELVFEEFANTYEILMSGIPMVIVENGDTQQFQSAGMCRIEAFSENERLELDKDKSLTIGMKNNFSDPDYKLYFFDETKNSWQEKAKDLVVMNQENIPVAPSIKVINDDDVIHVSVENNATRPFLGMWDNSRFTLMKGEKLRHAKDSVWWYDMSIKETKREGVFQLIFQGLKNEKQFREKVLVQPLIDSSKIENAVEEFKVKMRIYAQQIIAYQELLDKNEKEGKEILKQIKEQRFKDSVEAVNKFIADSIYFEQIKRSNEERIRYQKEQMISQNMQREVVRVFQVAQMGIYNCDRFYTPKYTEERVVSFTWQGEPLNSNYAYLVNPIQNAVVNLSTFNNGTHTFKLTIDDWKYVAIKEQEVYYQTISLNLLKGEINSLPLNAIELDELENILR